MPPPSLVSSRAPGGAGGPKPKATAGQLPLVATAPAQAPEEPRVSEFVDVGYRDPCDERDDLPEDPPTRAEYDPTIRELGSEQLKRLLAFGTGIDQVLARDELERRGGAGYQPSLLGPIEQLATARRSPR